MSLADQIREAALLEGNFVLRSGRRSTYYLDKYRLGTRPDLLRALGEAIAAAVREHDPKAVARGPIRARCRWRLRPRLELDLQFVIVRKEAKGYGTANRIEGPFERDECVCLIEDVVTSGGAGDRGRRGSAGGRLARLKRCLRGRSRGGGRRCPRAGGECGSDRFSSRVSWKSAAKAHG